MTAGTDRAYGQLGVLGERALADLVLVDGNPLQSLNLLTTGHSLAVVMKDGRIRKDRTWRPTES